MIGPAGKALTPPLTVAQVRQRVSVTAPTTGVLQLTATAPTAAQAEALAGAMAHAEVAYQALAASTLSTAQQEVLLKRGSTLRDELDSVNSQIKATKARVNAEAPQSKKWQADQTALAALTAQQSQLALQIELLQQKAEPTSSGELAQIIVSPTEAKRREVAVWTALAVLLGALTALGLSTLVLSIRSRKDRRLRTRDEVSDAVGSAVIGSVQARPQRTAAGWSALMEGYEPSVTDAWSLRQALDHIGLADLAIRAGRRDSKLRPAGPRVLTVVSLSDDPRGLAVAPQLASHAASLGVRTRLVIKQGHESSTTLWAACSALRRDEEVRPDLCVDTRRRKGVDDLVIEIVVVDRRNPRFVDLDPAAVTVLSVASSSATAEDLARTAVAAYEAGGRISSVIVADPDSLDQTTGRLLLQQRSEQPPLPQRLTGLGGNANGEPSNGGGR